MTRFAHIVNVMELNDAHRARYLHIAQPVTLRAMVRAGAIAASAGVGVDLCAVKHESETVDLPPEFAPMADLTSYAWEHIPALREDSEHKSLPRLVDILEAGAAATEAEYLIYGNVDISPRPGFYLNLSRLVEQGYDALCINRQNVAKVYQGVEINADTIELGLSLVGDATRGIDCFIFRRDALPRLDLGHTFVGFPPIGQVLKTQIERTATNFTWVKEGFYTFHLGEDRAWAGKSLYYRENEKAARGLWVDCFTPPSLHQRLLTGVRRRLIRWALRQCGRA